MRTVNYVGHGKIYAVIGVLIIGLAMYVMADNMIGSPKLGIVLILAPLVLIFSLRDPAFAVILILGLTYFGYYTQLSMIGVAKLLAPLIFLFYVGKCIVSREQIPFSNNWYLFLFILPFFASGVINNNETFSYHHQVLYVNIATYVIVRYLLRDIQDISRFTRWYVYLLCAVFVVGIFHKTGAQRLVIEEGSIIFLSGNTISEYIVVTMPLLFYSISTERKSGSRLLFIGIAVFFISLVLLSVSRGGLIGLLVGVFLWFYLSKKLLNRKMLVYVVLIGLLTVMVLPDEVFNNVKIRFLRESPGILEGDEGRMAAVKAGLDMIKNYPLLGVGPDNYSQYVYFEGFYFKPKPAHNGYLQVFGEIGILGGAMFLMALAYAFLSLNKARKLFIKLQESENELLVITIGISLVVMMSEALFYNNVYSTKYWFILLGLAQAFRDMAVQGEKKNLKPVNSLKQG